MKNILKLFMIFFGTIAILLLLWGYVWGVGTLCIKLFGEIYGYWVFAIIMVASLIAMMYGIDIFIYGNDEE